jgi:hypothetical protein
MCNVSADSFSKYTFVHAHNPDGEMPFFAIGDDLSRLAQQQQQQHHHRRTVFNRVLHLHAIFNNGHLCFVE